MKSSNTFCFFVSDPLRVPVLAEFAAAAKIGDRVDAARIEKDPARRAEEVRRHADAVAAVSVEQRRVAAVERHAFAPDDVDRNLRAVARARRYARDLHVVEVDRAGDLHAHGGVTPVRRAAMKGAGRQVGLDAVNEIAFDRLHLVHRRDRRQRRRRRAAGHRDRTAAASMVRRRGSGPPSPGRQTRSDPRR